MIVVVCPDRCRYDPEALEYPFIAKALHSLMHIVKLLQTCSIEHTASRRWRQLYDNGRHKPSLQLLEGAVGWWGHQHLAVAWVQYNIQQQATHKTVLWQPDIRAEHRGLGYNTSDPSPASTRPQPAEGWVHQAARGASHNCPTGASPPASRGPGQVRNVGIHQQEPDHCQGTKPPSTWKPRSAAYRTPSAGTVS